ncbi:MAG: ABC transporter ATP-binding protein [Bacteroidetes bacterium]|nr:ABC transporter ATP-binding protein [Bacteroidota bacterium]
MLIVENISLMVEDFSLNNINLSIEKGDYFVLLGLSGVGKSLLLETIAGLRTPSEGNIFLRGKLLNSIPIQNRQISIVYQDLVLFPHLNVYENIAYPLKAMHAGDIEEKVIAAATQTGIADKMERMPASLSGGEAQRAALARSIAAGSDIFLLDEPLSSIDLKSKNELRILLRNLNRSGITIVHVTHDYEEAISLATKIGIMENGKLVHVDTTEEIFEHPKSEFVAHFIGIKNFLRGRITKQTDSDLKIFVSEKIEIFCLSELDEGNVFLMIDPKEISISNTVLEGSIRNHFKGRIKDIAPARLGLVVTVDIGVDFAVHVSKDAFYSLGMNVGKDVWINFKASSCKVYN